MKTRAGRQGDGWLVLVAHGNRTLGVMLILSCCETINQTSWAYSRWSRTPWWQRWGYRRLGGMASSKSRLPWPLATEEGRFLAVNGWGSANQSTTSVEVYWHAAGPRTPTRPGWDHRRRISEVLRRQVGGSTFVDGIGAVDFVTNSPGVSWSVFDPVDCSEVANAIRQLPDKTVLPIQCLLLFSNS